MRGVSLIISIRVFGIKDGVDFWFRWSFIDPIMMFIWLNITHKPYCIEHGFYCRGCKHKKIIGKENIQKYWKNTFGTEKLVIT